MYLICLLIHRYCFRSDQCSSVAEVSPLYHVFYQRNFDVAPGKLKQYFKTFANIINDIYVYYCSGVVRPYLCTFGM